MTITYDCKLSVKNNTSLFLEARGPKQVCEGAKIKVLEVLAPAGDFFQLQNGADILRSQVHPSAAVLISVLPDSGPSTTFLQDSTVAMPDSMAHLRIHS